jgi:hypothetical protein
MIGEILMSLAMLEVECRPDRQRLLSRRERLISGGYAARWRQRTDPVCLFPDVPAAVGHGVSPNGAAPRKEEE